MGFTTEMPTSDELRKLMETGFAGTERDHSDRMNVLTALGCRPGDRLLDFGCSWGYGSWQLAKRGYDVTSLEVSKPRAEYAAKNLDVHVVTSLETLSNEPNLESRFDIFFSSHVIEHVSAVSTVLNLAFRLLKPGGLLVLFTPNGSPGYRKRQPRLWHTFWGFWHVTLPDDVFYDSYFQSAARVFASIPYDLATITPDLLQGNRRTELDLTGPEMLFVARKEEALIRDWRE